MAISEAPHLTDASLRSVILEKKDAIQVVVPSHLADTPIDITPLIDYLSADGMLLINARVNQAKPLFKGILASLENKGFLGTGMGRDAINSAWLIAAYKPQHPNRTLITDRLDQFWHALGLKQR